MLHDARLEPPDADYVEMLETQVRHAKKRIGYSQRLEEEMSSSRRV